MHIGKKRTESWDILTFISVGVEGELTKETERAATEEENQESEMSWKSSGKKSCQEGRSDQLKPNVKCSKKEGVIRSVKCSSRVK